MLVTCVNCNNKPIFLLKSQLPVKILQLITLLFIINKSGIIISDELDFYIKKWQNVWVN
jgi:hypothetical protein